MNKVVAVLRTVALTYPEAIEDFPWGERAYKVDKKIFVAMHEGNHGLSLTLKLPLSHPAALLFPFAQPAGYGLGKSGWVTATFAPKAAIPLELLQDWIDESYRAIAPKRLLAQLPPRSAQQLEMRVKMPQERRPRTKKSGR